MKKILVFTAGVVFTSMALLPGIRHTFFYETEPEFILSKERIADYSINSYLCGKNWYLVPGRVSPDYNYKPVCGFWETFLDPYSSNMYIFFLFLGIMSFLLLIPLRRKKPQPPIV